MSLKVHALAVFTVTRSEDQTIEVKQLDHIEFGTDGPNKKDVEMKLPPAISFGTIKMGHVVGVVFQITAIVMKIGRLLQFY